MEKRILLGRGRQILEFPHATWKEQLTQIPQHSLDRLNFMTSVHHRVRYFVVRELADKKMHIVPESISKALNMAVEQVTGILDKLEQKLFFW